MLEIKEEELKKILPSDGPSIDEVKRYLEKYNDEYIVIKCGGSVLVDKNLFDIFIKDISVLNKLGFIPIIVHGGGKRISNKLNETGIKSEFVKGLRVTSKETIEVVEKVLIELKSDNIEATAALVKNGNLIPVNLGKDLVEQKKSLDQLENNVAVNFDKIETQAEKESFENFTSSDDFIEVIDGEGNKWLVSKNNDGNKQAVIEVNELASENVKIGKVLNGEVIPNKSQPTKNNLSDVEFCKINEKYKLPRGDSHTLFSLPLPADCLSAIITE